MSLQYYTTQQLYNTRFTNLYTTSHTYLYKKNLQSFTKLKQTKLNFTCLQNSEQLYKHFPKTSQMHNFDTTNTHTVYTTLHNFQQHYTTLHNFTTFTQLYTSLQLSQLYTTLLHNLDKTLNTY